MDLSLGENEVMVKETARQLGAKLLSPRAAEMDAHGEIAPEVIAGIAESNLCGLLVPPPFGGMGMGTVAFATAVEQLAAAYASAGVFLAAHSMASFGILAFGSDELKKRLLPDLAAGKKIGALAVAEANAGTDTMGIATFGEKCDEGYRLNGGKLFISNAETADVYLVLVKTSKEPGPRSFSLVVAEKGGDGFSFGKRENKLGLRGDTVGELVFSDYLVPAGNVLGGEGGGLMPMLACGGVGAIGVAATAVGVAQACLDQSQRYASERKAFGSVIGGFEAIQLLITGIKVDVEAARQLVLKAAWGRDQGEKSPVDIWTARLFATEAANRAADKAHRIHGCYGYSSEYPVERFSRDARGLSFVFGTQEMLGIFLAKTLMGLPLFG